MTSIVLASDPFNPPDWEDVQSTHMRIHAVQEAARRELASRHLLHFTQYFSRDYTAGWVHEEVAELLMAFIEAIELKRSPRLIIQLPPRVGKSELVSRSLPPFILGKHPEWEVVTATYNQDLANDFGRDVRSRLRHPVYQGMFPATQIRADSNAIDDVRTEQNGSYRAVGVGGALTGRGAHCLPPGTRIATTDGERTIESIAFSPVPVNVLAYDNGIVPRPVTAVAARQATGLLRITTAAGRVVEATPDHRFLTSRGYVQADELAHGDRLLCLLQDRVNPVDGGHREARAARTDEALLLPRVLECGGERAPEDVEAMRDMRDTDTRETGQPRDVLSGVCPEAPRQTEGSHGRGPSTPVPPVRADVHEADELAVLLEALRACAALDAHDRGTQPNLEGWEVGTVRGSAQLDRVQDPPEDRAGARWACLRRLPEAGELHASREPGREGQSRDESRDALSLLPHASPQLREGTEADSVALVESVRRGSIVFDLEVAGAHNLFANGILTHNCLLIDDPVKNREDADSELVRETTWKWWQSVARTRLAPGGGVIVCLTRWHEDDLAGKMLQQQAANPDGSKWMLYSYPAIATQDEKHRKTGEALHPERWPLKELHALRADMDPREWSALYQQNPTPPEGIAFKREWVKYATPPAKNVNWYISTDFAIGEKTTNDRTVIWPFAVDEKNDIYFGMPIRDRMSAERIVDALCDTMERTKPVQIVIENVHISKTIGPFLKRRMHERRIYVPFWEFTASKDKLARASSLQGRMQQGRVFFHPDCKHVIEEEFIPFPAGRHDDAVDAASVGMLLLDRVMSGRADPAPKPPPPPAWSSEWIKERSSPRQADENRHVPRHLNGRARKPKSKTPAKTP